MLLLPFCFQNRWFMLWVYWMQPETVSKWFKTACCSHRWSIMAIPFARCMERASSVLPQQHYAALCSGRKDTPLFFFATMKLPRICSCRSLLTFPKYTFGPAWGGRQIIQCFQVCSQHRPNELLFFWCRYVHQTCSVILILGLLCFTNTGRAVILLETCSAALVSLHHLLDIDANNNSDGVGSEFEDRIQL